MKKRIVLCAILALTVGLYGFLWQINLKTGILQASEGQISLDQGIEPGRFYLLMGQWAAEDESGETHFESIDAQSRARGGMQGSVFRLTLSDIQAVPQPLVLRLTRSRGTRLFVNGTLVQSEGHSSTTEEDIVSLADAAQDGRVEIMLKIPRTSHFYSGYQGLLLGSEAALIRLRGLQRMSRDMVWGIFLIILLQYLVQYLRKRSETYILLMMAYSISAWVRFVDFLYPLYREWVPDRLADFYMLFYFMRYMIYREFTGAHALPRLDRAVKAIFVVSLAIYTFAPQSFFSAYMAYLNVLLLLFEGVVLFVSLRGDCPHGLTLLIFSWSVSIGKELFYQLLSMKVIPAGIVESTIQPAAYVHALAVVLMALALDARFADRFWETGRHAESLESLVREKSANIYAQSGRIAELESERQRTMAEMVHNMRTPITAVSGYVGLLSESAEGLSDEQRLYLGRIDARLSEVNQMITSIMTLNQLNENAIPYEFGEILLSPLLDGIILDAENRFSQEGIRFSREGSAEDFWLVGDSHYLRQAIENVLNNAAEHSPRGGSVVIRTDATDEWIDIAVIDHGEGISRDELKRVVKRGYSSRSSGFGLGLPIAIKIVEDHGGTLSIDSEKGVGTTCLFHLHRDFIESSRWQ